MTKYYYEVQTPHTPACGWLRSPYGRDTWERAFEEGMEFARNHHNAAGMMVAVQVRAIEEQI